MNQTCMDHVHYVIMPKSKYDVSMLQCPGCGESSVSGYNQSNEDNKITEVTKSVSNFTENV